MNNNVNEAVELLKDTKKNLNDMFDLFISNCKTDYDVIEIYNRICFQTCVSCVFKDRFRSKLNTIFNKTCKSLKLFREDAVRGLSELNDKYKNSPEHISIMEKAIKDLRAELEKPIIEEIKDDSFNFNISEFNSSEFNKTLCGLLNGVANEVSKYIKIEEINGQKSDFKVGNCYTELRDNSTGLIIPADEKYILSQFPGQRDINIGIYVGHTITNKYFLIPLGTEFVINYFKKHHTGFIEANSSVIYTDTLDELYLNILNILVKYLRYTDRLDLEKINIEISKSNIINIKED